MIIQPKTKPVLNNEIPHSIVNKLVTPNNQKKINDYEFNLDIFNKHNKQNVIILNELIKTHAIPKLIENTNGEYFIDPKLRVFSSLDDIYIKWLAFGSNMKPIRGHDYPMVQLQQSGYLMKVVVPNNGQEKKDVMMIEYFYNYRDINVDIINESSMISRDQINSEIKYAIKPFDVHDYPDVFAIFHDRQDFYENYVQDIFE